MSFDRQPTCRYQRDHGANRKHEAFPSRDTRSTEKGSDSAGDFWGRLAPPQRNDLGMSGPFSVDCIPRPNRYASTRPARRCSLSPDLPFLRRRGAAAHFFPELPMIDADSVTDFTLSDGARVYLAGPISGVAMSNWAVFARAAAWLRGKGFVVINPCEMDCANGYDPTRALSEQIGFALDEIMRADLQALIDPSIDGVVLLPGWRDSTGARTERFVADTCGIPAYEIDQVDGRWRFRPAPPSDLRLTVAVESRP